MGSRSREQTAHQPLLSSLVVRLTNNERIADFEPGEVNRDTPSSYSRSARFYQDPPPPSSPGGYRIHAASVSPVRRRNDDHPFNSMFDHSNASPHRGRGRGRGVGRYRQSPPRFSRGRDADRSLGLVDGGIRPHAGPFRGETAGKSNPNVEPRPGDWYCSDPACYNLNFARRDHCNNCHRPRRGTELSPRGGHPGPPSRCQFPGMDLSPRRASNVYRSPPQMGRSYGDDLPTERDSREGRFADRHNRRDQPGYLDDYFDQMSRFERRRPPISYAPRETIRDSLYHDRKGYERRMPSPPLPSIHPPPPVVLGRWARDRSRSPILHRDELPLKDYCRGSYPEHHRNERHEPLPMSALPQSPRAVSGRWAREGGRSPLRNELPPRKDYHNRDRDAYVNRGRDDRHGLAGGRDGY